MSPLVYALNIATLAIWLSLTGLDVVGWTMPIRHLEPKSSRDGETAVVLKPPEISLGVPEVPSEAAESSPAVPEVAEPEVMPTPPELPATAEFPPLPEVPELSAKPRAPVTKPAPKNPASKPAQRVTGQPSARPLDPAGAGGSGLSATARMAAGQMPPPAYPAEARRKGQTGTVLIEFIVGTDGRVISAYPLRPSPWPVLDNEAVRTVRGWKFPPGAVMKLQRPIVFQLK
ncbi:MAG: energy transducer TonB [Verrucomicrobia bacterium]|nr:energy transducer TonB [Verrucomicrobiota bacterium]